MRDDSRRDATISGLREMADFLEAHPDVPDNGGHGWRFQYSVSVWFRDETSGVAEVDRVAKELDVTTYWDDERTQYTAERQIGPHTYLAVWCRPDEEDA
jgi:hypothetical protein